MCEAAAVRICFVAAVRCVSSQPTLRCAPGGAQSLNNLRESVRLQVNLPYELLPCLVIPLDVGSAQAGHESLDVAQRQPEFMRCSCKNVVGTGHDRFQNTGHEYLLECVNLAWIVQPTASERICRR